MEIKAMHSQLLNVLGLPDSAKDNIILSYRFLNSNKSSQVNKFLRRVFMYWDIGPEALRLKSLNMEEKRKMLNIIITLLQLRKDVFGGLCIACYQCKNKIKIDHNAVLVCNGCHTVFQIDREIIDNLKS